MVIIGYCCCVVWELSIVFYGYVYYGCFSKYSLFLVHIESRLHKLYSYFKILKFRTFDLYKLLLFKNFHQLLILFGLLTLIKVDWWEKAEHDRRHIQHQEVEKTEN